MSSRLLLSRLPWVEQSRRVMIVFHESGDDSAQEPVEGLAICRILNWDCFDKFPGKDFIERDFKNGFNLRMILSKSLSKLVQAYTAERYFDNYIFLHCRK